MKELKKYLTKEEITLLDRLNLLNEEDLLELEDKLSDYIQLHCIDSSGNELTNEGIICEDILNKIGDIN